MADLVLQDPTSPKISKLFYKRTVARLQGMNREERNVLFYDPIEEEAKLQLSLINEDESVIDFIEPDEDHASFLLVYHRGMDTKAKTQAISARQRLLSMQPKQQEQPQG